MSTPHPGAVAALGLVDLTPCRFHLFCERWVDPAGGPLCPVCVDEFGALLHPVVGAPAPVAVVLAEVGHGGPDEATPGEIYGHRCWMCGAVRRACLHTRFGWECPACHELATRTPH